MTCVLPVNVDRAFLGLKMYGTDKARCPIASCNYSIPDHNTRSTGCSKLQPSCRPSLSRRPSARCGRQQCCLRCCPPASCGAKHALLGQTHTHTHTYIYIYIYIYYARSLSRPPPEFTPRTSSTTSHKSHQHPWHRRPTDRRLQLDCIPFTYARQEPCTPRSTPQASISRI